MNHVLKEKELEIRPEFPFYDLPHGGKQDYPILSPIEPDNMQGGQTSNGSFDFAGPSLERDSDEETFSLAGNGSPKVLYILRDVVNTV